jgi:hypothetical protein
VQLLVPNGILTYTTNGVSHLQLLNDYYRALDKAFKAGYRKGLMKRLLLSAARGTEG